MIDGDAFERLAEKHNLFYATTHELQQGKMQIDEILATGETVNVLSHNSDGGILNPDGVASWFDYIWTGPPYNLGHWFAQNCDVRHPRLTPIPIGLETDRWHPPSQKKDALLATAPQERTGLVYLNHTIRASHRTQRKRAYELFGGKVWVTIEHMDQSFEHYYRQLASHKFVFSPDGNGMDSCRTWEALYLGCYPIVERHVFTEEFAKVLPLLIVDDWTAITEDSLQAEYARMSAQSWRWDALTVDYWDEMIRSKLE